MAVEAKHARDLSWAPVSCDGLLPDWGFSGVEISERRERAVSTQVVADHGLKTELLGLPRHKIFAGVFVLTLDELSRLGSHRGIIGQGGFISRDSH